jgi:hypothetical protein
VKRKAKNQNEQLAVVKHSPPSVFEVVMNLQCDLRAEMNLDPLPHWRQTRPTPDWAKNICGKLRRTILKSVLKLRPKSPTEINWRNYGRCVGIIERYKTFLNVDVPRILESEGFNDISPEKWEKIQPLLGEGTARDYYLKVLKRPPDDPAPLEELAELAIQKQLENLEALKQMAFYHLAHQSAKTGKLFLKGMEEGYTAFLNEDGEFTGDDRRADIHMELLAWQHDIEKMRRMIPAKNNQHLVSELKKNSEFKNKSQDWFKEVFKDIKLSIGPRGRPRKFSRA